jgi:glycosyltransferase involved in cell wall biosynthesis
MMLRYALVTPARDEAENVERLAGSLAAQTVLPARWLIVDNGSTDGTVRVAAELAGAHSWIDLLEIPPATGVARGGPIVRAFHAGLSALGELPDVVVKLDADVTMSPEYFERLLDAFAETNRLGIASGTAYELEGSAWVPRHTTGGTVWGAVRAYRRECLSDVLPLEERMGWDGVDALKANLGGWETRTIPDLRFEHHRVEGIRDGARWRAWDAQGRASHFMGYRPSYLLFRSLRYALHEPSALAMVTGYATAAAKNSPRCSDPAVRDYLRSQQTLRALPVRVAEALGRR